MIVCSPVFIEPVLIRRAVYWNVKHEEQLECSRCGEKFTSEKYLREHYSTEHPGKEPRLESASDFKLSEFEKDFRSGVLTGLMIAAFAVVAFQGYQSYTYNPVDVTVVTCENCSHERFKGATERYFDVRYEEVNWESSRGQELIEKYNANYIPLFVFEKDVESHRNFTRVRNALVEFEDAYVMSDQRNEAAQRFSKGFNLN